MKATTMLVLPADVVVSPVADLPLELSERFAYEADDCYVTRPHTRQESVIIDVQTAALLECFRTPTTVVDAVMGFCRTRELDAQATLDSVFGTLATLIADEILTPAEKIYREQSANGRNVVLEKSGNSSTRPQWKSFDYCEIYKKQFSEVECCNIVASHVEYNEVAAQFDNQSGGLLRDCDVFWIQRRAETDWIFARLWKLALHYNEKYKFQLSQNMGMAQLTRYRPGQKYDWHMDLGAERASLRKISMVVQLSSRIETEGGATEIFYGDLTRNRANTDVGDILVFPAFITHRASMVTRGVRWSLVVWLSGSEPFN